MNDEERYATGDYTADDPRAWARHARGDLEVAMTYHPWLAKERLCFWTHEASQKAVKALYVARRLPVPDTRDIKKLVNKLVSHGATDLTPARQAEKLQEYADDSEPRERPIIDTDEYLKAVRIAHDLVDWIEKQVFSKQEQIAIAKRAEAAERERETFAEDCGLAADHPKKPQGVGHAQDHEGHDVRPRSG